MRKASSVAMIDEFDEYVVKIIQPDSRTVRVEADNGIRFFLPYRLTWNGHDREPASVVLETSGSGAKAQAEVKAFFLFGMVRDAISEDSAGIRISRSWNVMTPGPVTILVDVEFDAPADPQCLFPGVHCVRGLPRSPVSFLGERTSYPASVIVSLGSAAAMVFSRSASCGGDPSSIGICAVEQEDEPVRLRVEMRFPGVEQPRSRIGPGPGQTQETEDVAIQCAGSLERAHEVFITFASREEIVTTAAAAALKRLQAGPAAKAVKPAPELPVFSKAAREVLATHLVEEGGVEGVRETPGSPWLSSCAGLALAIALRKLFPRDGKTGEIALRLADFSLKGQLPSGRFYESYNLDAGQWRGLRGRPERAAVSVALSARIADRLLALADDLEAEGLPFEKYFLAGQRFVDSCVDDKGRLGLPDTGDIGELEVFFPLARVLHRLGKDRYKKALDAVVRRFAAVTWDIFQPPSSRSGRDSDSAGALLAARLFVEMRRRGYRPAESPSSRTRARAVESTGLFASLLVPWIRVHRDESPEGQPGLDGAVVDSFVRQRLLFAGCETAWLLQRLGQLAGQPAVKTLLGNLSRLCLAAGRDVPPGTAFFQHTRWDAAGKPDDGTAKVGPVDSRRLGNELLSGLAMLPGGKKAKPSARRPAAR